MFLKFKSIGSNRKIIEAFCVEKKLPELLIGKASEKIIKQIGRIINLILIGKL